MKRLLTIVTGAILGISFFSAPADAATMVNTNSLPIGQAPILGNALYGQDLQIQKQDNKSLQVDFTKDETQYVQATTLHVRSGAGLDYPIIGLLTQGQQVKIVSPVQNGWAKIEYNGEAAYVPTQYLEAKQADSKQTQAPAEEQHKEQLKEQPKVAAAKEIQVVATSYCASEAGNSDLTAAGYDIQKNPGMKLIAVDPKVIPLGTKVWVEGYGEAIAGDTGGAIKGNRIDVLLPTLDQANQWGRKTVTVRILE
ncbi:3D domain-containing protein [Ectobacillus polymachus]|uniref:3D domain-containing protein n=1 Tax=Ectobacillus polymachus TaxID=1508806 RepID=UPI003A893E37